TLRQRAIDRLCSIVFLYRQLMALRETLARRMHSMAQQLDEQTGGTLPYQMPEGGCGNWDRSVSPVNMRQVFDLLLAQPIVI
ncbi:PLP-dependent aminotransferase family protein, partial [Pseudomonas syringae pv. tagetis]